MLLDTVLAAGLVVALIFAAALTERILKKTMGDEPGTQRIIFTVALLASFVLLSLWILNHYWLPHKFHPLSLISDLGLILVFAIVGFFALVVRRGKAAIIVYSAGVIVLFFSAATMPMQGDGERPKPSLNELSSLPYLTWVPAERPGEESGVVYYDTTRSSKTRRC